MKRPAVTVVLLLAGICSLSAVVRAQTTAEDCAQDLLELMSPASISVAYSAEGRPGVNITWPEVEDAETTCAAVTDTTGMAVRVTLDGVYADDVDRELNMLCLFGGEVGGSSASSVIIDWSNRNLAQTGQIVGEINLSNNGGLLGYSGAAWGKYNDGLPVYLPRTDIRFLTESPVAGGGLLATLRGQLSRGLWHRPSGNEAWIRLAPDVFSDGSTDQIGITAIAFSPDDADVFAVGTVKRGLYVTRDGGLSFTQYQTEFAETGSWSLRRVSALSWTAPDRLYVAIDNLGFFRSADGGASFDKLAAFLVSSNFPTGGENVPPEVNVIVDRGTDGLLVGLDDFGLYESLNGGASWQWIWNSLLTPASQPKDVYAILSDPADAGDITVGTRTSGLWWTPNHGETWIHLEGDLEWPAQEGYPLINSLSVDQDAGLYLATADGLGILSCALGDTAWTMSALTDTGIRRYDRLLVSNLDGIDYLIGTYGGGIYTPETPIRLSDTIVKSQTGIQYQNVDMGVFVSFGTGTFAPLTSFTLVLQDFQGYAVWRSSVTAPDDMELIGVYDKNNPESCIEGYCGDVSYNVIPNCYADKRAACFDFRTPGTVGFFDGDVYEGFTYNYAVTTFDYGNIAAQSPNSLSAEQLFSARFTGDELSTFGGAGNRVQLYVHRDAVDPVDGPDIFAYPNPLRLDSGFSGAEGEDVRFKNLPPESRVQVFTLDGDLVADLGPELQAGDIIVWTTRNGDELLASGVYIYKVVMPERETFFGKVVIIR